MDNKAVEHFTHRLERELMENILPFWLEHSVDHENGGFVGRMSNDLVIDAAAAKGLILNTRLLWTFSAVYRYNHDFRCLELARRAYDYLERYFWDEQYGGAFWQTDCRGKCIDDKKKIYGQAFYLYALSEFYLATQYAPAMKQAVALFQFIEQNSYDHEFGGYFETCNRDGSLAEDARLSDKDLNEKKSMNNHLHLLEAYTHFYRIHKDPKIADRLWELIRLFQLQILDIKTIHFHHFFDERWQPKSSTYTFGHDIEGSWLLTEAADALNNDALSAEVNRLALALSSTVCKEGIDQDGGLFYEGQAGAVIDTNKEWWPQAEAVVGFLNAWRLSGKERFFAAALKIWTFIENRIVDKQHGDWFWRVSRDGEVDHNEPKVSEWKGPYHNTRACLESIRRLKPNVEGELRL
ncbi:MAG: N-acyl-D-glucosamine 2-epimerase [Candidatus Omnitrophota bacterium]|jgi:mannobiose 2-epimerase|nr:MAG: N-acyl-D-glucosamine 2-epimerase [Candidatus Omnitrophota bacterium]